MTDKENALRHLEMTANFVILSLLQKGEKSINSIFSSLFSVFCMDTELCYAKFSMTKFINITKISQYDKK